MTTCEGCGAILRTGLETFGRIGQAFCFDCFQENLELEVQRELLMPEMESLERQCEACQKEWNDARESGDYHERLRMENIISCATMRIEDLQDELNCLTIAYQRQFSVIGRAS